MHVHMWDHVLFVKWCLLLQPTGMWAVLGVWACQPIAYCDTPRVLLDSYSWDGLEAENKGWEGIHYYTRDGERYLMGLCESE
jgi:hypothetical protein